MMRIVYHKNQQGHERESDSEWKNKSAYVKVISYSNRDVRATSSIPVNINAKFYTYVKNSNRISSHPPPLSYCKQPVYVISKFYIDFYHSTLHHFTFDHLFSNFIPHPTRPHLTIAKIQCVNEVRSFFIET